MSELASEKAREKAAETSSAQDAPKRNAAELKRDIASTRRELAETLDALEYKFDVPTRFAEWSDDRRTDLQRQWETNPGLLIGIAVGALAAVGAIIAGAFALPRRGR